jgi:hypothetical protein
VLPSTTAAGDLLFYGADAQVSASFALPERTCCRLAGPDGIETFGYASGKVGEQAPVRRSRFDWGGGAPKVEDFGSGNLPGDVMGAIYFKTDSYLFWTEKTIILVEAGVAPRDVFTLRDTTADPATSGYRWVHYLKRSTDAVCAVIAHFSAAGTLYEARCTKPEALDFGPASTTVRDVLAVALWRSELIAIQEGAGGLIMTRGPIFSAEGRTSIGAEPLEQLDPLDRHLVLSGDSACRLWVLNQKSIWAMEPQHFVLNKVADIEGAPGGGVAFSPNAVAWSSDAGSLLSVAHVR